MTERTATVATFGTAIRNDAAAPVDSASLARLDRAALEALFATLPAPPIESIRGHLRGRLLGILGFDLLPAPVRAFVSRLLWTPLNPWRTKSFEGGRGANWWGVGQGRIAFARYRVEAREALDGTGPVLALDYDIPENLAPLRPIRGEARALGPGLYLARMTYGRDPRPRCLLYFTLES